MLLDTYTVSWLVITRHVTHYQYLIGQQNIYIYQIDINIIHLFTLVGIILWVIKVVGKILIGEKYSEIFKTNQIRPARISRATLKTIKFYPQFFLTFDLVEPQKTYSDLDSPMNTNFVETSDTTKLFRNMFHLYQLIRTQI